MEMSRILVVSGLFVFGNIIVTDGQVCDSSSYIAIDDPRRSTMAVYDYTSEIPLCDDSLNGAIWYRFQSYVGETVVERAENDSVPINRCGTEAPIYIRGLNSHPSADSTTLAATVCANYGSNSCNWMETIQIHRCPAQGTQSAYFLYKLKPPPGCSLSYCVGEKPSCRQSEYWTGFSCVNYFPSMTGFPLFAGPTTKGSGLTLEVYFTCRVQYTRTSNDTNARFRVTFLFDGQILEHVTGSTGRFEDLTSFYLTVANSSTQIILGENHLRGRLGREISCKVESYWDGYEPGNGPTNATMLSQAKFYAAMESQESSYVVNPSQGANFEISFRSTIPLTCRHCSNAGTGDSCCEYNFLMSTNISGQTCGVKWKGGYIANVPVYILPGLSKSLMSYGMSFKPFVGDMKYDFGSLWHGYLIPPVMVATAPSSTNYKRCRSTNDPYIYTFDGSFLTNMQVGDFYLVRATHSMEVQVRQEVCGGGVYGSCNCGVIVREGNSAIKISICEKGPWNATVQRSPSVVRLLSQDPVDSSTVYRDTTGRRFSVRMPSGLRVEFDTVSIYLDIYVYLPPVYHKNTSLFSMCGNSNGIASDDITSNIDNFRIPDIDNYFKSQPKCSSAINANVTRCDCINSTTFKCSDTDELLKLVSQPQDPLPDRWSTGEVCPETSKFAATAVLDSTDSDFILDPEVVYPPYSYDPNYGVNVSLTWPTRSGKTEQNVTQYCENIITSSVVYQDCEASVDVAEIITACKTDIQITDEWTPEGAYTSVLQEICVNQLAANINSSNANSDRTLNTLTSVYEKTCPNQCSGHGTCDKANCVCNPGYIGTDCGIPENQPPLLASIVRNGVCDVRLRPCDVISVFGSGIISTAPLKCRFTDQSTGSYVETSGTFITSGEYSCPVPGTTTHRRRRSATDETAAITTMDVSMTMNGGDYSNNIPFVLFDSVCMQCSDGTACKQKSNACAINGQCYANKATNTNDQCLQCLPETSLSSWTDASVVQEWKPCTRQCDYGARSRDTLCSSTITRTDVELCKATDCPENKDEEHEGVGLTLSEDDLEKILTEPDKFFIPITKALNSYCSTNAVLCCHSVGVSSTSVTSVTYTSPSLTTYASGYPVLSTSDSKVKIIVKIDENRLRADCAGTTPVSSSIVYANTELIYNAVSGAEHDIEEELGVTIVSVWSPKPAQQSTASATFASLFSIIGIYILLKGF